MMNKIRIQFHLHFVYCTRQKDISVTAFYNYAFQFIQYFRCNKKLGSLLISKYYLFCTICQTTIFLRTKSCQVVMTPVISFIDLKQELKINNFTPVPTRFGIGCT